MQRVVVLILLLVSCHKSEHKKYFQIDGIHHWNTTWRQDLIDSVHLDSIERMYVHIFDVDLQSGVSEPIPSFWIDTIMPLERIEIVPIAYLTEAAFQFYNHINKTNILARRISKLVNTISQKNNIQFHRFYLDFDWTIRNQEAYFTMLDSLREIMAENGMELCVTLRLHQLRLSAGMRSPPVREVLLMCYNMGNMKDMSENNAIYDHSDFELYMRYLPGYPLDIRLAIPVFYQTELYRNNRFVGLLRDIDESVFINDKKNFQRVKLHQYKVLTEVKRTQFVLNKGDIVKFDIIEKNDLNDIKRTLEKLPLDSFRISIFDLENMAKNKELTKYAKFIF